MCSLAGHGCYSEAQARNARCVRVCMCVCVCVCACSGFTMECGTNHYLRLMQQFDKVIRCFLQIDPVFQRVIEDITKRMGEGMAKYIREDVSVCVCLHAQRRPHSANAATRIWHMQLISCSMGSRVADGYVTVCVSICVCR